jgi:hypothetical protein
VIFTVTVCTPQKNIMDNKCHWRTFHLRKSWTFIFVNCTREKNKVCMLITCTILLQQYVQYNADRLTIETPHTSMNMVNLHWLSEVMRARAEAHNPIIRHNDKVNSV